MLRTALPASRDARLILLGTLFSAVGRGLTLPFLFIYLTKVRHIDGSTVGLLVGWTGAVSLLLAPLAGTLIDRLGARYVVAPLQLVSGSGSLLLAFADGVWPAFLALTVIAVGFSGVWSGWTTILATLVTQEERQRTFGLSFTLLNLGIGTGGLIAGLFVDESRLMTFQALYLGDAVSLLLPLGILLGLRRVGRRAAPDPAAPAAERAVKVHGGYGAVLRDRAFVQFFLFALVLTAVGYAQIEVGFTAFSANVAHVPARMIGWAFTGNTIVIVLLQLFVIRWLEGRSRTRALAVVALVFGSSWLVLGAAGWAGSAGLAVLAGVGVISCSMIFAFGETLMSPVMPAITNALATDELRGRYNAMASMVFGISGVVGPVAAGPLIGSGHATLWLIVVVSGCLVASTLALRLRRRLTAEQNGRAPAIAAMTRREAFGAIPESTAASP